MNQVVLDSDENILWIWEIDLLFYSSIIDYIYKRLLPSQDDDKIQPINRILEFAQEIKMDILKVECRKLQEMKYFCII